MVLIEEDHSRRALERSFALDEQAAIEISQGPILKVAEVVESAESEGVRFD